MPGLKHSAKWRIKEASSRAARILGISGPTISKQIKNLEARLNLVLLHRTARAVTLTEAGRRLTKILEQSLRATRA